MKKHCEKVSLLWMVMLLWVGSLFAQAPGTLWTRTYGGTGSDYAQSVQQTSDGGYIIAGSTQSFGAGAWDVYLIKTDANGNPLWERTYGGAEVNWGFSVQQTSDGGYIIAGSTGWPILPDSVDVYLIRTSSNGDPLWTRIYGGTGGDWGYSVQQTSDGGYIVAGGTMSFGVGGSDVYLIKLDVNGDVLWTHTYGEEYGDFGFSVQQTSDGGYIIAGETNSFGAGTGDIYLIKTDANGDTLWTKTYGGTNTDVAWSVQETSDGGYIIAGYTASFGAGSDDVYLIKTDANGNPLWDRTYGGAEADWGFSVQQTSDGGYIIAGYTASFGAGSDDVYLIKTNANGDTIWTKTYGGIDNDEGGSAQQTSDGGYIVAGVTMSFGVGYGDVYLIKLGPETGIDEKEHCSTAFFIFQSEPNPFKDRTLIKYGLPKSSDVHIVIYNLLGQEVKTLVNEKQNAGIHTIIWDGRDSFGKEVPSGVYFCKIKVHGSLEASNYTETKKMIVLR